MEATQQSESPDHLYQQVENYDWDNDAEFQGGLQAILASASSPEQMQRLTTRAKCFYYTRKFSQSVVDLDGYQSWLAHREKSNGTAHASSAVESASTAASADERIPIDAPAPVAIGSTPGVAIAPAPASFAEICELIAQGKPIPGIKEIPDTVLEGQGTQSTAVKRQKPWEKDQSIEQSTPNWLAS